MNVWETFLTYEDFKARNTDNNTFDQYEKKTYDEFIYSKQLISGKIGALEVADI